MGPEDVAAYIYALLTAPSYRSRYAEFLQQDYPRIPVVPSAGVARKLIELGQALIDLHLLDREANTTCRISGEGRRTVDRISFAETEEDMGRIVINDRQAFESVPADVWEYMVGGFQVCENWLKVRRGRELSIDDVEAFRRIVGAIAETLRLTEQLEEVLEDAGGLPFAPALTVAA